MNGKGIRYLKGRSLEDRRVFLLIIRVANYKRMKINSKVVA
jgi:hypothetical protein